MCEVNDGPGEDRVSDISIYIPLEPIYHPVMQQCNP